MFGSVEVAFRLRNVGRVRGAEVPQVYVGRLGAPVAQPPKRLAGFDTVELGPGECRRVTVTLDKRAFSYWGAYSDAGSLQAARPALRRRLVG